MRKDSDLIGEMEIPDDIYYGIQTVRASRLGDISFSKLNLYPEIIRSMAQIKKSCALANVKIQALAEDEGLAIAKACDELIVGKLRDQFAAVDMYSGGGAIAINMSINEVLANRANEILTGHKGYDRIHPNTHVNMCQSTNDVVPSAMKIVVYDAVQKLVANVLSLEETFAEKVREFEGKIKLGRTCLNDALPVTFSQEFSGYLSGIRRQRIRIEKAMEDWLTLTLSGTAVGTGVSTMPGYQEAVYEELRSLVNPRITMEENIFDGMQNADSYLYLSGLIKCLAVILSKISYDLKLLGSGPYAGFGELVLPTVQAGSSIMPGKVNPALPEMIIQVAQQVCGNDITITMAVEKGELDLNIADQILLKNLLDSISLLTRALPIFAEDCVKGIKISEKKAQLDAEKTTALVTMYSIVHGYKPALKIALDAVKRGIPVKQAAIETGSFTKEQADELFDPLLLTDVKRMHEVLKKYAALRDIK
jgi:aspartate ammonia-lyase